MSVSVPRAHHNIAPHIPTARHSFGRGFPAVAAIAIPGAAVAHRAVLSCL